MRLNFVAHILVQDRLSFVAPPAGVLRLISASQLGAASVNKEFQDENFIRAPGAGCRRKRRFVSRHSYDIDYFKLQLVKNNRSSIFKVNCLLKFKYTVYTFLYTLEQKQYAEIK